MSTDIERLDYNTILNSLYTYAKSSEGLKRLEHISLMTEYEDVVTAHKKVLELMQFYRKGKNLSFNEYTNIKEYALQLKKGSQLSALQVYEMGYCVIQYFNIKSFIIDDFFPLLSHDFTVCSDGFDFCDLIIKHIRADGYIEDIASRELKSIRSKIEDSASQTRKAIQTFYKQMKSLNYSSDDIVSIRDGYECVAVKSSYKSLVDGVIIDYSSTGQTAFVVPETVLKISSELQHLKVEEKAEERRIIRSYCDKFRNFTDLLEILDYELVSFEQYYAKARYAIDNKCESPEINDQQFISILNAKHPILGDNAVPLNIELGKNYRTLVVTGPNAGGKTVVLKTIGLLVFMVQTGIPVPVSPDSSFCVYESIYIDIGDEQSLTDALSTFSGHMNKIKKITDTINDKSLVLIDELGSGTDPVEGSALAEGIINFIHSKNCLSIITTHYPGLKYLPSKLSGCENASMLYDNENHLPLYQLRVGIPGSSRAFDIAKHIGIDNSILDYAREIAGKQHFEAEEAVRKLEMEHYRLIDTIKIMEEKIASSEKNEQELSELIQLQKEKNAQLEKIIKSSKIDFMKDARKEFEQIVRKIKENNASRESILESKTFLESLSNEVTESEKLIESPKNHNNLKIRFGDAVRHIENGIKGTVISIDKDEAVIQFGAIKLTCKLDEIEKIKIEAVKQKQNIPFQVISNTPRTTTLDVRGQRFEEAEKSISEFIDRAIVNGIDDLTIIHGIGTGVLRKCIHDFLRDNGDISDYGYEKIGEKSINYGVTKVSMKF